MAETRLLGVLGTVVIVGLGVQPRHRSSPGGHIGCPDGDGGHASRSGWIKRHPNRRLAPLTIAGDVAGL